MSRLHAETVTLGYDARDVIRDLSVTIPDGRLTMIVGANASGKSTLLRGLVRLLRPRGGAVLLDGRSIAERSTIDVARVVGLLPQSSVAPDGITVGDLVGRGRYPHQGWFRRWTAADDAAVADALAATGIADLIDRPVAALSGGQRQRVWVAMALAQDTDLLLLDEPTTYLDIAHQVDLLDLLHGLVRTAGKTIVVVMHDLGLACRYADQLIAMGDGRIVAEGAPTDIVTPALVRQVFGIDAIVVPDPLTGSPLVVPRSRQLANGAVGQAAASPDGAVQR